MTLRQLEAIERIKLLGYALEYDRAYAYDRMRVVCKKKLGEGTFSIMVRPDGTYRDARYKDWHEYRRQYA